MIGEKRSKRDEMEFDIFEALRKIIKAVDIYSTRLKEKYGINSSQLSCLLVLGDLGSISFSKLSQMVSLSPSMITGIIDQLESKELVTRVRNSPDRRVILIELTENGKKILRKAPPSFQKKLMDSLGSLGNKEKMNINKSLVRLLSFITTGLLIDSPLLKQEEKLTGVKPSILKAKTKG